ncbi:MAG: hypothetical protein IPP66_09280 [Anaerolineales bacterium]|nr:hypothetical protein [Anaerolineales bacterium]
MFTRNKRNQYDKKDSLELGQNAESQFVFVARRNGWKVVEASKEGNIEDHYDYEISKDDQHLKVDVKSKKRVSRKENVQDDFIWVEFRTVRDTKGWLFGSADLIAFENQKGFKIVERKALVRLINKLVDVGGVKVKSPEDALYKTYTRKGRPDEMTLIKATDLDSILWAEWPL